MPDTLALVELTNADDVGLELGDSSLELLLGEFETRLRGLARREDELVPLEAHKFCVVLRDLEDPYQVELAAAKLVRLFEETVSLLDEEVRAEVCAAFVPPAEPRLDTKARLKLAERTLREARAAGRPYLIRSPKEQRGDDQDRKREREIRQALDEGEFVMYFQPQVHAGYRNVVGAEALMRWHNVEHGVRSPAEFLPYIRQPDLLRQLSWFAIKSSISVAARWPDPVGVAVNLPPSLLRDPELVTVIGDSLDIFALEPGRLTLEITEDAMIEDPDEAMLILDGFRRQGVRIAVDDFGTGYSSLAYFRDLPVDELKIDRSFVSRMLERSQDRDIVKAIVDLAHNFSLKVVAEGVEDEATAQALQALGCDLLQGFLFGEPQRGDDFLASL